MPEISAWPDELFGLSERWLEAELALKDKEEGQRIAALKAHVARTRAIERIALAQARGGVGMH